MQYAIREVSMNDKKESDKDNSIVLSVTEEEKGFSISTDDHHNIILLEWNKPVAWFSAAMPADAIREFIELIKCYDNQIDL